MNFERYDVGVFDSGVGGLSVVRELLHSYPNGRLLYLADQCHVPYGGRPLEEIRLFATGISRFLASLNCDAIVMACNVSSATALTIVKEEYPSMPVVGMINGVSLKVANFGFTRIGILATHGTVISEAYPRRILEYNPSLHITQVACPSFVPLVEAGILSGPQVETAIAEYLQPLAEKKCQAIILGCTHYPFLLPSIERVAQKLFASPPIFMDPAITTIEQLTFLKDNTFSSSKVGSHLFLTTGDPSTLHRQIPMFLGHGDWRVEAAQWNGLKLLRQLETSVKL